MTYAIVMHLRQAMTYRHKNITGKAKVDDADMKQAINNRKKLIEDESQLLEDHRKENKEILTRHFYNMSNIKK